MEYVISKRDPCFESSETMLQRANIFLQSFSDVFKPFFGLHNVLPLARIFFFLAARFSDTTQEELYHPPGKQQPFGEHRFSIGYVPLSLGSRAWIETFQRFRELLVLLARKFEITKTSRESLLVAYDCCLAHLTTSHTPPGAFLNFAGCGCWWGSIAARQWIARVPLGIGFCLVLCSPNFKHCSASKSRCGPLLRTSREPIWRDPRHLWMEHSWAPYPNPKPRTSQRPKRNMLTQAMFCTVSIKHLEIRGIHKPGTRGRLGPIVALTTPTITYYLTICLCKLLSSTYVRTPNWTFRARVDRLTDLIALHLFLEHFSLEFTRVFCDMLTSILPLLLHRPECVVPLVFWFSEWHDCIHNLPPFIQRSEYVVPFLFIILRIRLQELLTPHQGGVLEYGLCIPPVSDWHEGATLEYTIYLTKK